jgi:hypothetical protein
MAFRDTANETLWCRRVVMLPNMLRSREHRTGSSFHARFVLASLVLLLAWGTGSRASAQGQPITFSVIADIPYSDSAESLFLGYVDDHNLFSPSEFFVHVGDIKSGTTSCSESRYSTTSDILSQLTVPTFILPGDNEWNDCSNPDAAWDLWESYFTDFEQPYCGTPPVEAQAVRHENFAFVSKGVLFVGLNVVGGAVHDSDEWATRLQQDADWVDLQFTQKAGQTRAAVVFGHAGPDSDRDIFFDQFEASSAAFGKPVLYIMGDDHSWEYDNPFSESNMARITIERDDPPLEVTVLMDSQDPWLIERVPWPNGTPVLNRPPCVEVGPDQTIVHGDGVSLSALVTDDGVPVPGGVSLVWSQISGPGQASIDDDSAADTTATFSSPGSYILRMTANDGPDRRRQRHGRRLRDHPGRLRGRPVVGDRRPGDGRLRDGQRDGDGRLRLPEHVRGTLLLGLHDAAHRDRAGKRRHGLRGVRDLRRKPHECSGSRDHGRGRHRHNHR